MKHLALSSCSWACLSSRQPARRQSRARGGCGNAPAPRGVGSARSTPSPSVGQPPCAGARALYDMQSRGSHVLPGTVELRGTQVHIPADFGPRVISFECFADTIDSRADGEVAGYNGGRLPFSTGVRGRIDVDRDYGSGRLAPDLA